ncbi:MAG: tRNA uridine-5-carboxymethylaminomethyl(34) synthesis GTPase MnmE [Deltaproteobacteria bacterium]|nr:tRNA uridine-5-carboxymethylaminomethyl(34) synthesis GTPase MnmE [Deltaproteobacteria bacterium]
MKSLVDENSQSHSPLSSSIEDNELIAAVATALGAGAVSIIRLSGRSVLKALAKIFSQTEQLAKKPRTMVLGRLVNPVNGCVIDQVLAVYFPGPGSFTGEDSAEIQGHGGSTVPTLVLEACLDAGARLARPGEFTQRAFLNGQMSLDQAEAVAELVASQSRLEVELSARHLEGALAKRLNPISSKLKSLCADSTAYLDFEEEYDQEKAKAFKDKLTFLIKELEAVINLGQSGRIFRTGLRVALAGPPNVGKSSLFNALLGKDRALVSRVEGTTRDYLESSVDWQGLRVELVDTAGLREEGADELERLGQELTKREMTRADVVVSIGDLSRPQVTTPIVDLGGIPTIKVWNKVDLAPEGQSDEELLISALTGQGLEKLKEKILSLVGEALVRPPEVAPNLRQQKALEETLKFLKASLSALEEGHPLDIVSMELSEALAAIGLVTGRTLTEDMLQEVFSRFCLGK